MNDGLNLADVAALNDGFGGGNAWTIIILFILIFGMGNFGYGRGAGEFGQYATAASQQEILFGQQFQNLDNKLDRLGNGIADATFALNNQVNNVGAGIAGAVTAEGRAIQGQIADFKYDNAMQANEVKTAVHAEGEATRAMIQQNKIETLQAQVNDLRAQTNELKTQNMFCGIPRINPYGYGVYAYNNCGCGCNNNAL